MCSKQLWAIFLLFLLTFSVQAIDGIDVSLKKGNLILTSIHGGDGSGWGKKECAACHFMNRIHSDAPVIRAEVKQRGFDTCTGCHGSNGTDAVRQCLICHQGETPLLDEVNSHDFSVTEQNKLGDDDCLLCHDRSDMDGKFELGIDLTAYPSPSFFDEGRPYRSKVEFCLRCHNETHQIAGSEMQARFDNDPLITIETSYKYLDVHGRKAGTGQRTYAGLRDGEQAYGDVLECTDCHAMHGTHNDKLIVDRSHAGMTKLAPAIRDIPVLIDVVEGDYSQLCVTCHVMNVTVEQGAKDTGNGLAGVHRVGEDCRVCHVHGLAVQTGL